MKKEKKAQNIKVRIVEKPRPKKEEFLKRSEKEEKEPLKKIIKRKKEEEKRKKTIIAVSITLIMVIIFITWISFLGKTLSSAGNSNEGFWQRLISNLKNDFTEIKNDYEQVKSSFNLNIENSNETQLERDIFPETK